MDEKTQINQNHDDEHEVLININTPTSLRPSPPCYESTLEAPPPPSYLQSTTRLYYKNQPYISDSDQALYNNNHEYSNNSEENCDIDSWSYIAKLPLHQRLGYYFRSWLHTVYDGRLIFFAFFILAVIIVLGLMIPLITIPSLFKHH
ncbi:hypothetical protein INT46_005531 [Mucor plumbeus]|uniref:Uncharacterized protein n=1 Tax=Mucor plumbeus TaxID=97098 RepID=A0A8H7QWT1_9FUNG|nr:hypothetical protein INT46_005531 [Mucor plumbeus]